MTCVQALSQFLDYELQLLQGRNAQIYNAEVQKLWCRGVVGLRGFDSGAVVWLEDSPGVLETAPAVTLRRQLVLQAHVGQWSRGIHGARHLGNLRCACRVIEASGRFDIRISSKQYHAWYQPVGEISKSVCREIPGFRTGRYAAQRCKHTRAPSDTRFANLLETMCPLNGAMFEYAHASSLLCHL